MDVPLLDTKAQNLPLESEFQEAFRRVLHSGMYILGGEVTAFEDEICAFTGANHAVGVSSGTDALLLALMALDVGPGDEVICPAFTFFATAGCIRRVGAVPVFADSDPADFNLSIDSASKLVTERTKAIMPVHLFGQCVEMDGVMALASEHGLAVIEDAAQAMGAGYRGKQAGTTGHCGTFSFFPSKNLGALGDAGMLVTNDDALAERARVMRVHGMAPKYYHRELGGNFRIDALQCAMLRVKLKHFDDYTSRRRANAAHYSRHLEVDGITLPTVREGNEHIWNQYTLRVSGAGRRDALRDFLSENGIMSDIYYPLTMDQQECFRDLPESTDPLRIAHLLATECLSIPVYPELEPAQRDHVVETIRSFASSVRA